MPNDLTPVTSHGGIPPLPFAKAPPSEKKHIVLCGLGMVGIAFLEKMLMNDAKLFEYTITVIGEEPYLAYNRVGLTDFFQHRKFENLLLSPKEFYEEREREHWNYSINEKVIAIQRDKKIVQTSKNNFYPYDYLVMATGSSALLPYDILPSLDTTSSLNPLEEYRKMGCFVYRTIDDLQSMISFSETTLSTRVSQGTTKRAIVVGGGLLGLEAAKALKDIGAYDDITVVHRSHWLLSQQMDQKGGNLLTNKIKDMGVTCRTGTLVDSLKFNERNELIGVKYNNGEEEDCSLLCYTIGIKARDEVAKESGIEVAPRGGIVVDDYLQTSDESIYAIGECASWNNKTFGLIAPGVAMADILSFNLTQAKSHSPKLFTEPDIGTRLKLMGVDVASFGDYFADKNGPKWLPKGYKNGKDDIRSLVFEDPIEGLYTKVILTKDGKYLLGGILVGDTKNFTKFTALAKSRKPIPVTPSELIIGKPGESGDDDIDALSDDTQVCSCHNITKGALAEQVKNGTCKSLADLKKCTKAGTACGGCEPTMKVIFETEMKKLGQVVSNNLCTHFEYSRADLFSIIMVKRFKSFKEIMTSLGKDPEAAGCEICKPTVGSILSTLFNRHLLEADVHGLQDTNDRFLGNIQRNGTYSVVPRMSAGEITPEKLIAIGNIAKKYDVYTKITGAQRLDLFGVKKSQLPSVWKELNEAGFESGQAYGKSLRNVKSCVGSTWCRYGIGDSVGLAIRLEERYKGIRSPHKMKGGVSGCVRDCAEFHSKDFGLCAVQNGFNVYVGGNGGMKPAHAQLLKADCPPSEVIALLDRYLMFYFRTADRLQRTARWLENLQGGIEYLRDVVVHDKLGICKELEDQMNELVGHYFDEWSEAVKHESNPVFQEFANTDESQDTVEIIRERGQRRPADWPEKDSVKREQFNRITWSSTSWQKVCSIDKLTDSEAGSGITVLLSNTQLAIFKLKGKLYAAQNMCGHKRAFVLSQGILSTDDQKEVYISCPLHKRNYVLGTDSENSGSCKNDADLSIATFEAKEENGDIYLKIPPLAELDEVLGTNRWQVKSHESVSERPFTSVDKKFNFNLPKRALPAQIVAGGAGCSSNASLEW